MEGILTNLGFHLPAFFCQIVLFVVMHYALRAILYDRMIDVRNRRDGQIEGRLAEAEKAAANARRLKEEYDESVRKLRHELSQTLAAETAAAEKAAAEKMKAASEEASRISNEAHAAVDAERASLEAAMESRAEQLAKVIGRRVVESNLSDKAAERALSKIGS